MRTEDDSWDVTTSVGSTGLLVAAARVLETQKADPLAIDPYAEVFCRAAGGEWADVLDGKLPDHYLTTGDFGEHFVNFQGARTRYFDEYFSRATAAGIKQVSSWLQDWIPVHSDCNGQSGQQSSSWIDLRSSTSRTRCSPTITYGREPNVGRLLSICAMSGR